MTSNINDPTITEIKQNAANNFMETFWKRFSSSATKKTTCTRKRIDTCQHQYIISSWHIINLFVRLSFFLYGAIKPNTQHIEQAYICDRSRITLMRRQTTERTSVRTLVDDADELHNIRNVPPVQHNLSLVSVTCVFQSHRPSLINGFGRGGMNDLYTCD